MKVMLNKGVQAFLESKVEDAYMVLVYWLKM